MLVSMLLSRRPIVVAPMAGGPSTPELVVAAADAGAIGFLAAGYKTVDAVEAEMAAVRQRPGSAFGVNLFVPHPPPSEPPAIAAYVDSLRPDAAALDIALGEPSWDDD